MDLLQLLSYYATVVTDWLPQRNQFVPSQIHVAASFWAIAKLVPAAKLAGVIVATPAPLFENIFCSPTTVPSARLTARPEALLHIIYDAAVEAAPSAVIVTAFK